MDFGSVRYRYGGCFRYLWISARFNIDTVDSRYLTVQYRYGFDADKSIVETSMRTCMLRYALFSGKPVFEEIKDFLQYAVLGGKLAFVQIQNLPKFAVSNSKLTQNLQQQT